MLAELVIEDLSLIEKATLTLGNGLNVITGETGAGKSLLIGALEFLLGVRAGAGLVRAGADRARVEGRFVLADAGQVRIVTRWLEQHLAECADHDTGTTGACLEAPPESRLLAPHASPALTASAPTASPVPECQEHTRPEDHAKSTSAKPVLPSLARADAGAGAPDQELELVLARTSSKDGRSRAHVNHRPVTQRLLRELAGLLMEIHGQNDHQSLLDPSRQTELLDGFGHAGPLLARYREARTRWLELVMRIERSATARAEQQQRAEMLRFQLQELRGIVMSAEDHAALLGQRELLRHAAELNEQLSTLLGQLVESDQPALDVVRQAERILTSWQERVAELANAAQEAREASAHLTEVVAELEAVRHRLEHDPDRLQEIEDRVAQLALLQRKYRTDVSGLEQRMVAIETELSHLDGSVVEIDALEAALPAARATLVAAAGTLTRTRIAAAQELQAAAGDALCELGLERAEFQIGVHDALSPRDTAGSHDTCEAAGSSETTGAHPLVPLPDAEAADAEAAEAKVAEDDRRRFAACGTSSVEFRLAANPGEPLRPLREVASGGEMARVMLALRAVAGGRHAVATLVFDEIDAGVGGRLGPRVGCHLRRLSAHHQVVCVTHLPAIAACADQHLRVAKDVSVGRTRTQIVALQGEQRVQEVADMIAGGAVHATARAEARRLLREGQVDRATRTAHARRPSPDDDATETRSASPAEQPARVILARGDARRTRLSG